MLVKTSSLTMAERLLVHRRRRSWTQQRAAQHMRVSTYRYRLWESGSGRPSGTRLNALGRPDRVGRLLTHEQCFLLRRRRGVQLKACAKSVGVCKLWLRRMEAGRAPTKRLVEYWEAA